MNLVARVLALFAGAVLVVGAFVLSVVFFAFVLVVGIFVGSYFAWRARHLRRQMQQRYNDRDVIEGTVISSQEIHPPDSIERR